MSVGDGWNQLRMCPVLGFDISRDKLQVALAEN